MHDRPGPADESFRRLDETPDPLFYALARKVVHIDDGAIGAVTKLYAELLRPEDRVLDLMSSWRSHLPGGVAAHVTGVGMNADEMADNPQLDEWVVHDVNAQPRMPFGDGSFDACVCCVSVQYMVRPRETFDEVARVLRDDGPFVVTFSNRCFPPKAIAGWLYAGDAQHVARVQGYFEASAGFGPATAEDRSPGGGDPLYAVWARRTPR